MFVWKIVSTHEPWHYGTLNPGEYFSCRTTFRSGGVIYRVNKWSRPRDNISKLLAFDSLQAVKKFEIGQGHHEDVVFLADALAPAKLTVVHNRHHDHQHFWLDKQQGWPYCGGSFDSDYAEAREAPEGTVACDAIRLIAKLGSWGYYNCEWYPGWGEGAWPRVMK